MKWITGRRWQSGLSTAFVYIAVGCILIAARSTSQLLLVIPLDDFAAVQGLPRETAAFGLERKLSVKEQEVSSPSEGVMTNKMDDVSHAPNRVLLGIFTTNSPKDAMRRKLIRRTYLSNYNILKEVGLASSEDSEDRLCSLADLIEGKRNTGSECKVVYTFVMGNWDVSNTTAYTDLTQIGESDFPFVVDDSSEDDDVERDVVHLNIRENMNYGKTSTWFKYASTVLPAENLGIDLIAKVDLDTIVVPRRFLEDLDEELQHHGVTRPAHGVYGGVLEIFHPNEVLFMQGGFYFLSRDVAQYITSSDCPRDEIAHHIKTVVRAHDPKYDRAEDVEIGNFIAQCWDRRQTTPSQESQQNEKQDLTARRVFLSNTSAEHHPVFKDSNRFRVKWKQSLAIDLASLRYGQIKEKYNGGCPTNDEALEDELRWFDGKPNMQLAKGQFAEMCSS